VIYVEARYSPHFLLAEGGPSDSEGVSLFFFLFGWFSFFSNMSVFVFMKLNVVTHSSLWKQTVVILVSENGNTNVGARSSIVVKALCYKLESHGFETR
jgi:hypothetical protein